MWLGRAITGKSDPWSFVADESVARNWALWSGRQDPPRKDALHEPSFSLEQVGHSFISCSGVGHSTEAGQTPGYRQEAEDRFFPFAIV